MARPSVAPEQCGRLAEAWASRPVDWFYDALGQMKPQAALEWMAQQQHEAAYQYRPSGPLRLTAWLRVEVVLSTFPVMADWQAPGDRLW